MKDRVEPNSVEEAAALLRDMAKTPIPVIVPTLEELEAEEAMENEEQLPEYTIDDADIQEQLEDLAKALASGDTAALPLTSYPILPREPSKDEEVTEEIKISTRIIKQKQQIIITYFSAITTANIDLLNLLFHLALITPETTSADLKTPLLAAIEAGKSSSVKYLLSHGALINAYGITETNLLNYPRKSRFTPQHTTRTPLQYAAELGNLALVKLLMESGADDSLVAPDGQLALRLAASNGHREIVDFLPSRRGGGFRRWKCKHSTAMRRVERAVMGVYRFGKFFVWDVPRFFVWSVPKYVLILPIKKRLVWLREHWGEVPAIVGKKMEEVWRGIKRAPKDVWEAMKKFPDQFAVFIGIVGGVISSLLKRIWTIITKIPAAIKIVSLWIWSGITATATGIINVLKSFVSLVHTAATAVATFFQRITWKDICDAFVTCLRAIFIELPKVLWKAACWVGKGMKSMVVGLSECLWECCVAIWELLVYVPKKLGQVVMACGSSARAGGKELLVWVDPKRV